MVDPGAWLASKIGLQIVLGVMLLGSVVDLIQFSWLIRRWFARRKRALYMRAKADALVEIHRQKMLETADQLDRAYGGKGERSGNDQH